MGGGGLAVEVRSGFLQTVHYKYLSMVSLGPWIICNVHLIKDVHPGIVVQKDFDQLCKECDQHSFLVFLILINIYSRVAQVGDQSSKKPANFFILFIGPFQGMVSVHL